MADLALTKNEIDPLVILQQAVDKGASIEQLQMLMELQERWLRNKDKAALRHGMAEFKKEAPAVIKSRTASVQTKSGGTFTYSFADLDGITSESQKLLANHGITHAYKIVDNGNTISVTCILKYGVYEEDGATLTASPDTSGTKNDIQAKASSVSYLEKYTFMAAVGLAAGMPDTDGNKPAVVPAYDLEDLVILIAGSKDLEDLKKQYGRAYKLVQKLRDSKAMAVISEAKDQRKAELESEDKNDGE